MLLKNHRAVILVENIFNDHEFWYPYYRFLEEGAQVEIVAPEKDKKYTGKHGTTVVSTAAPQDVSIRESGTLIIPGGYAPDHMRRDKNMVDLVSDFHKQGKIIGAICHAGWMLASADILRGRTVTSFFAIRDDLVNAGANWVDQEVCTDEKLVTSRTPDDLPAFMRTLIKLAAADDSAD